MATRRKKTPIGLTQQVLDVTQATASTDGTPPLPGTYSIDAGTDLIISIPAQRVLEIRTAALKIFRDNHDRIRHWETVPVANLTDADYQTLDSLLLIVRDAAKEVEDSYRPLIELLRLPLEQFYGLRKAALDYVGEDETLLKKSMAAYKLEEHKRIQAQAEEDRKKAEEIAHREERERQQRLEAARQSAPPPPPSPAPLPAPTWNMPVLPGGMPPAPLPFIPATVPMEIFPAQITYLSPPSALTTPVRAAHSSSRIVKKWRIVDLNLAVDAALLGLVPLEVLTLNTDEVDARFKLSPDTVAGWPGFEVYDNAQITGR